MKSIKDIIRIGFGPSSSHSMGPVFACEYILNKYKDIENIKVTLLGSLAITGKGHLTDYHIDRVLDTIPHEIIFDTKSKYEHPNTMIFEVSHDGKLDKEIVISIGGGTIVTQDNYKDTKSEVYPHNFLREIIDYCKENKLSLVDYILKYEDKDILEHMSACYDAIEESIARGIKATGENIGPLHVKRKARDMYLEMRKHPLSRRNPYMNMAVSSFAVAEENANGGKVVIAPTCGSAGVLPGGIAYLKQKNYSRKDIVRGMLVAGLIGDVAKTNGSVSGAEAGCQAEIGVAGAMTAAMIAYLTEDGNIDAVEQSAEIALEHSLGLTCDPVGGYVQIPCIERCAMYSNKALSAVTLARIIPHSSSLVSFDASVKTMLETGRDLKMEYRETGIAGLSKLFKENN